MNLLTMKKASMAAVEELINFRDRRQLENTIYRVYVPFSHQHEQWANKLFDLSFLIGNGFDVLAKAANNAGSVTSHELAQAWADQFGFDSEPRIGLIEEATGIADEFLNLFLQEFDSEEIKDKRVNYSTTTRVSNLNKDYESERSKFAAI